MVFLKLVARAMPHARAPHRTVHTTLLSRLGHAGRLGLALGIVYSA